MKHNEYDIIIIGGGATGSGIAVDVASRGFKTLLLEKNDFSEGTSSRSTKLVHGGVRYLEAAVKKLDKDQYDLVKEGLKERAGLLKNAPHLASRVTLVTPIYKWWELPYMFAGLTMYDLVSGKRGLGRSSIVSREAMIKNYPVIKKEGLVGGVKYYDGRFNDARMAISLLQTAQKYGAECKNYHEVTGFLYDAEKVTGVSVHNTITNEKSVVKAKVIINATGPFSDKVRALDNQEAKKMLDLSSGIHIVLDKKYLPSGEGLMIPKTEDGRVLFILPWMDKCLVGTTDEKTPLEEHPRVAPADVDYILKHLEIYFDMKIDKSEILSHWSGIRPLVAPDKNASTSSIVRDHLISQTDSGIVSIIGGKWTTYRKMAEEVADYVIDKFTLENKPCVTEELRLVGSENYTSEYATEGIDDDIAKHLHTMYGDQSKAVCACSKKIERLHPEYAYINAEVIYTIKNEFVQKPIDFLVRRSILALIDTKAAKEILDAVLELMKDELGWDERKVNEERVATLELLDTAI